MLMMMTPFDVAQKTAKTISPCRASIWQIMISSFEYEERVPADVFSILILGNEADETPSEVLEARKDFERDKTRQIFKVEFLNFSC